jgi:Cupredoxin-like domain
MTMYRLTFWLLAMSAIALAPPCRAEAPPEIALTFLGDRFEPAEVPVPVGVKFTLRVENKSAVVMEWESEVLHREKVVPAGTTARIAIVPLRRGDYEFFDDFHDKIRGRLVAR